MGLKWFFLLINMFRMDYGNTYLVQDGEYSQIEDVAAFLVKSGARMNI